MATRLEVGSPMNDGLNSETEAPQTSVEAGDDVLPTMTADPAVADRSPSTQLVAPEQLDEADESTLTIDNTVVEKIVAITCRSVDGILQMKGNLISSIQEGFGGTDITKGVSVEMVGEDACNVSVSIIMEYGKSAPKIFRELHDKISEKITDMTGLRVNSVNVRITNVMTREEMDGGRRREKADPSEGKLASN